MTATQAEHSGETTQPAQHNETLGKTVIEEEDDRDARRVKRTYRHVIDTPSQLTFLHAGDRLVRLHDSTTVEDTIEDIGPDLSDSNGLHVRTADGDVIHLDLIRRWIANENAYITGERTETFTEVEGLDY